MGIGGTVAPLSKYRTVCGMSKWGTVCGMKDWFKSEKYWNL